MSPTLLTVTLIVLLPAAAPDKTRRIPGVPNFPDLTREQDDAFDRIIDNVIRAESGLLKPDEAQKARDELDKLPPEAIFALIRGLNRTPPLETSRAAQVLAKKTAAVLRSTTDVGLLEFAHENIGAKEPRKEPKKPSAEQEKKFDQIVDAFIEADLGNLRGEQGVRAKQAFERLPPEAIFALIRGLNKASTIDHSCPVTVISKKLRGLLVASKDPDLLDYALDNIGGFSRGSRHVQAVDTVISAALSRKKEVTPPRKGLPPALVQELRLICTYRKGEVLRAGTDSEGKPKAPDPNRYLIFKPSGKKPEGKPEESPSVSPGTLGQMTVTELARGTEAGDRASRKKYLVEIEKRSGAQVVTTLARSAGAADKEVRDLAGELLVSHLSRQETDQLKSLLRDERSTVRLATVKVVAQKQCRLGAELIELLRDSDTDVRKEARAALVKLARGTDYGPTPERWRTWWAREK
jgi:hypothetical protein